MTFATETLGQTGIAITPVALGCWPIAGMTSLNVNDDDSVKTLRAAVERGVNFFDTAYCYGANGESEKLAGQVLHECRDDVVIATKGGIHWDENVQRVFDASPGRLKQECEESLTRLGTDRVELLYLHAPDPKVPVAESAGALLELKEAGKARAIGVSNFNVAQLEEFSAICPIDAHQPPYNMLQRQIEQDTLPWCHQRGISTIIYWPLMKGLLAGHLKRDHVFEAGDGRAKYPMFQGEEWQKNQDFLNDLRLIAKDTELTVSQLVVKWTIQQPGVTAALCGAKRAYQIEETAGAMGQPLHDGTLGRINSALQKRGDAQTRGAV